MLIKKAKYKTEMTATKVLVANEIYGCDLCKKELNYQPLINSILQIKVWRSIKSREPKSFDFCSWKCLLKFIPDIKSNYFVTLPPIDFDSSEKLCSSHELIELINSLDI